MGLPWGLRIGKKLRWDRSEAAERTEGSAKPSPQAILNKHVDKALTRAVHGARAHILAVLTLSALSRCTPAAQQTCHLCPRWTARGSCSRWSLACEQQSRSTRGLKLPKLGLWCPEPCLARAGWS